MFERAAEHKNKEPFDLPQRWIDKKEKLALTTPFNFVSDADIIGGGSRSPRLQKSRELIWGLFYADISSPVLYFVFTDQQACARSVPSAATHHSPPHAF